MAPAFCIQWIPPTSPLPCLLGLPLWNHWETAAPLTHQAGTVQCVSGGGCGGRMGHRARLGLDHVILGPRGSGSAGT